MDVGIEAQDCPRTDPQVVCSLGAGGWPGDQTSWRAQAELATVGALGLLAAVLVLVPGLLGWTLHYMARGTEGTRGVQGPHPEGRPVATQKAWEPQGALPPECSAGLVSWTPALSIHWSSARSPGTSKETNITQAENRGSCTWATDLDSAEAGSYVQGGR